MKPNNSISNWNSVPPGRKEIPPMTASAMRNLPSQCTGLIKPHLAFAITILLWLATLPAFGQVIYEPYTFTTLAGQAGGRGRADGTGPDARFSSGIGNLVLDGTGNLYVTDEDLRKVTPAGVVTSTPWLPFSAVQAIDGAGNLYVDRNPAWGGAIWKIRPDGKQSMLAGFDGTSGSTDGLGGTARFKWPAGMAVDGSGNVYVADAGNSTIRRVTPEGFVTTLAGKAGTAGTTDGTGNAARFQFGDWYGLAIALDKNGNLYVPNLNTVRKVTPEGVVTTIAGKAGISGSVDGPGSVARFRQVSGMAVDGSGNVYAIDSGETVRKITPDGVVTTLAGKVGTLGSYADGSGADARFGHIRGIAADQAGNLFVTDSDNTCIRKITPDGAVTTFAGRPSQIGIADGMGTAARFLSPCGLAVDSAGNVAVADSSYIDVSNFNPVNLTLTNSIIRNVSPAGEVTTLAGKAGTVGSANGTNSVARFKGSVGVAFDGAGNLYVADLLNNKIRKVTPEGVVTTFAGPPTGSAAGNVDGASDVARFKNPTGLAVDGSGNVYVADIGNNKIRKVTPDGVVTTLAAVFSPYGLAVDTGGNLYVSSLFDTISKVTSGGVVTLLAGSTSQAGWVDGDASEARFWKPAGLALDGAGNVYVADELNMAVRKITPAGRVTTLAGALRRHDLHPYADNGGIDGTGSSAKFNDPVAIAVDKMGTVYVSDAIEGTIRVGRAVPSPIVDDFSSGSDAAWTRYDALAGVFTNYVAATFAVNNGQYRISIPKPTPNPYGYVRALPYRGDQTYGDFEVSADIAAWDNAGGSWLGVLGRMNQIGLNKTSGYMFWYRSDVKTLFLNVVRGESGYSITPNQALTLDPTHQYRFTLTGIGERLTGTVVDLAAPEVVLASMTGLSGLFSSGYCGLFCGSLGGSDVTYDNFVARTPAPAPPSLNLTAAPAMGFAKAVRYPTGLFPHGIDKGDLNHDGALDLVIANNRGANVSVFLGHADGSFTKQPDYAVGAGPVSPVLAKLNADDFLDLVVANGSSTNVSVLLGKGDGTLGAKTDFTVGSRPASIAVGDYNKDGMLDLVTANSGSTNVSVLLGNGDGTFKAKADFMVGKAPLVVRAADLNGDGILDLVTANSGEDTISVLLGRADGTFQDKVSYAVGKGPSSVAIGDFNGDGHLDVVVANRSGNSVMVLPGQGDGTLGTPVSTTFVWSPWDLVVADLDGDGHADLVVTTTVVGQVALLMGQGDGHFSSASSVLDVGDNCTDAVVADFNGDQRLDLAVVCQFGDRFEVLFNGGKPAAVAPAMELSWPLPADGYVLEAADNLPGPWSTVNAAPVDRPGQRRAVGVERTGDSRFFRLQKP